LTKTGLDENKHRCQKYYRAEKIMFYHIVKNLKSLRIYLLHKVIEPKSISRKSK
jgi:hypothetical protein